MTENLVHRLEMPKASGDDALARSIASVSIQEDANARISLPSSSSSSFSSPPRLVKKFSRSAAGQKLNDPRDVREPSLALRTARYLIKE